MSKSWQDKTALADIEKIVGGVVAVTVADPLPRFSAAVGAGTAGRVGFTASIVVPASCFNR